MNITVKNGKVRCDKRPVTMQESKLKIQACVKAGDTETMLQEIRWLQQVHARHIDKVINTWLAEVMYAQRDSVK